jgi:hypothetical protein
MKPNPQIVAGGGWVTRQTVGKPKARLFGFLSVIWTGVLIGASIPFWNGSSPTFSALDWMWALLLVPEPVFIGLAIAFWIWEKPRTIIERQPNPSYDPRNYY